MIYQLSPTPTASSDLRSKSRLSKAKYDHSQVPGVVIPRPEITRRKEKPSGRFDGSIDRIGSSSASVAFTHPFKLRDASLGGDSPVAQIKVTDGTLNGSTPANVGIAIAIDDGTWRFYLDVEVDLAGAVVSVSLIAGAGAQPSDTDYHGFVTLGMADASSGKVTAIRQATQHSLGFQMCGRVVVDEALVSRGSYEFWGL